jgi:hypothetical protein
VLLVECTVGAACGAGAVSSEAVLAKRQVVVCVEAARRARRQAGWAHTNPMPQVPGRETRAGRDDAHGAPRTVGRRVCMTAALWRQKRRGGRGQPLLQSHPLGRRTARGCLPAAPWKAQPVAWTWLPLSLSRKGTRVPEAGPRVVCPRRRESLISCAFTRLRPSGRSSLVSGCWGIPQGAQHV